jgi:SAM-dependent methyltransferase
MNTTSWQPVSGWYDTSLGQSGDFTHREIVIPKTLKLLTIKQTSSLLDLGCGQGILARAINPNIPYTGIDIAQSLVNSATKRDTNKNHRYYTADITKPLPLGQNRFSHVACILTLDNVESPECVMKNAFDHLEENGTFVIVINHPCFRIPRQSSWGIDEQNKIQYRRINRYLSPLSIPITMHPGTGTSSPVTWTYHFPISSYCQWLHTYHFCIEQIEEWVSPKTSVGKAASMENRSREEFPMFLAICAQKKTE